MDDYPLYIRKIDQINEIILDLYNDEADRKKKYLRFLKDLQEVIYFDFGNFVFFWENDYKYDLEFFCQIGWHKKIEELYTQKYYKEDDVFPIFGKKTPVIMKSSDMFDPSRTMSQYYHDFMEIAQFDISLECNIILPEENCYGICSLFRKPDRQNFDIDETRVLEILQPHLSNSTKIIKYIDNKVSLTKSINKKALSSDISINSDGDILPNSEKIKLLVNKYRSDIDVRNAVKSIFKNTGDLTVYDNHVIYQFPNTPVLVELNNNDIKNGEHEINCRVYDMRSMIDCCISIAGNKYGLSGKEQRILEFLMKGYNREDISKLLSYSVPTVKKYVSAIYRKLSVNNYSQLLKKLEIL